MASLALATRRIFLSESESAAAVGAGGEMIVRASNGAGVQLVRDFGAMRTRAAAPKEAWRTARPGGNLPAPTIIIPWTLLAAIVRLQQTRLPTWFLDSILVVVALAVMFAVMYTSKLLTTKQLGFGKNLFFWIFWD